MNRHLILTIAMLLLAPIHYAKAAGHPSIVSQLTAVAKRINPPGLNTLIKEAIVNNPDVRESRDRWLAEVQTTPQARALPDPEIVLAKINLSGDNVLEEVLQDLEFIGGIQAVPFPGKLYYRGKIANIGSNQANAEYQAVTLTIVSELKRAYYDLYFTNRAIEIYEKNKKILEEMRQEAKQQYASKQTIEHDVFLAEAEISRMEARIVTAQQARQTISADINRILNRDLEIPISTPDTLKTTRISYKPEELYAVMRERSPDLLAHKRGIEKGKTNITLKKMDYFSDVELEADKLHDGRLGVDGYQVILKGTLPLYFFDKQNKAVIEATERYHADVETYQKHYQRLAFRVKDALLVIKRSIRLIDFYQKTLIPEATLALRASMSAYHDHKIDFFSFRDNLIATQEDELQLQREIVANERAITDIEEAVGIFL